LPQNPLHALMNPRSIATVGAGNNPLKMGAIQALSIIKDGYRGKFYPVHPTEEEVFGFKAYRSAAELPETPDLVMFVMPAASLIPVLEEFGEIGTKRAIIISGGFRETGSAGKKLEEKLLQTARRYDMRFLGPNCIGVINSALSLNVTLLPFAGKKGSLGMASQSGTYVTQTLPYLADRGIHFSKAISVGNESDINMIDALEYLGEDEQTKAIALYIEGIRDAARFLAVARQVTARKPVVAQYVGGTDAGARAGSSHTGALASPDYLIDGLFKQAGVLRVDSLEDLYYQGWSLATQPPLRGRRIGVLTNSGGPSTAVAHTCSRGGLDVPLFSADLQQEIKKHIQPQGSAANPVDLTFHMDASLLGKMLPEMIARSGEVDGIIAHGVMSSGFMKALFPHAREIFGFASEEEFISQFSSVVPGLTEVPQNLGIPFLLSSFFGREDKCTALFQDHNMPVFDGPEKAARGMLALYRYSMVRRQPPYREPQLPSCSDRAAGIIRKALELNGVEGKDVKIESNSDERITVDEYSSKQILAAYGVPVSSEAPARTEDEAAAVAAEIGFPVVLKGLSPAIAHKTGRGLIQLDLADEEAVRRACRSIREAAGEDIAVLVSKMVAGEREVMAGIFRAENFGPAVLFGAGGIFAEALADRTFRLAPLSGGEAEAMLDDIRSAGLLKEQRGFPAADRIALSGILQALGNIALLHPEIAEIDLNPIIIAGGKPIVADALVVLDDGQH